jgi:hypothetical protein
MKKAMRFDWMVFSMIVVVIGFTACREEGLTDGSGYLPTAEVLERVRATPLEPTGDGGLRFGTATMQPREGNMKVVRLTGPTPYELGFQHGILLKDCINRPTFQFFADPLYHGQPPADLTPEELARQMEEADKKVFGPMERNMPHEYLEELKGIADGSGLDFKTVFRASFLSDYDMVTMFNAAGLSGGECSGVMVSGDATSSGKLIVGRNTDYEGQKQWVENQVILIYDYPGAYRYASVSTAGLLKCNSAMNETGIVVSGHWMPFLGANPNGYSFTIFENEIMRKTDNLAAVSTLLKSKPRCGSFGLVVGDGKTGQALAFEATKQRLGIRGMEDDSVVMTNYALTPEQISNDIAAKLNIQMRDVGGRYARLLSLVKSHYGLIEPGLMAEFISNHIDMIPEVQRERGAGNTVGSSSNVTSVVFQPADGFFWVASGGAPACGNEYVGYDFWAELNGGTPAVSPAALPGYAWQDNRHRDGFVAYMEAELVYQVDRTDIDAILAHLAAARSADPEEPRYYQIAGRFHLRRGFDPETANTADVEAGIYLLEQSLDDDIVGSQANNERAAAMLYLGMAADLRGERRAAIGRYSQVLGLFLSVGSTDYLSGLNKLLVGTAIARLTKPYAGEIPGGLMVFLYE